MAIPPGPAQERARLGGVGRQDALRASSDAGACWLGSPEGEQPWHTAAHSSRPRRDHDGVAVLADGLVVVNVAQAVGAHLRLAGHQRRARVSEARAGDDGELGEVGLAAALALLLPGRRTPCRPAGRAEPVGRPAASASAECSDPPWPPARGGKPARCRAGSPGVGGSGEQEPRAIPRTTRRTRTGGVQGARASLRPRYHGATCAGCREGAGRPRPTGKAAPAAGGSRPDQPPPLPQARQCGATSHAGRTTSPPASQGSSRRQCRDSGAGAPWREST